MEVLISQWSIETHTIVAAWGEFTSTFAEISRLTLLPLLREENAIGIIVGERDRMKYLMTTVTTSRPLGKATYATWLRFFYERDNNHSDFILEASLAY